MFALKEKKERGNVNPECHCRLIWVGCDVFVFFQLEEIRNIGSLPCLEKLNLSSNPICIIPDYRTKVLAQFGDRAAEVHHQNHHNVYITTTKASTVTAITTNAADVHPLNHHNVHITTTRATSITAHLAVVHHQNQHNVKLLLPILLLLLQIQ